MASIKLLAIILPLLGCAVHKPLIPPYVKYRACERTKDTGTVFCTCKLAHEEFDAKLKQKVVVCD